MADEIALQGVKWASIVAGFLGAIIRLSYIHPLGKMELFIAVSGGTVSAYYLTPLVVAFLSLPAHLENGVAFLSGLVAMSVIPGVLRMADLFKNDPLKFVAKVKSGGKK